jgi:Flp pilus assembly pilin Flp
VAKASCDSRRFPGKHAGATVIEYVLMLALIAIVCMAGVSQIGSINALLFSVGNTL